MAVEIHPKHESAILASASGMQLGLWTHVSRCQEFRSCTRPILRSGKPTITCPRVSRLDFVIFRPVVERDYNPHNVAIWRTWSRLHPNFERNVTLGVWIMDL